MLSQSSTRGPASARTSREEAGNLAISALVELAKDIEIIGRFMTQTGVDPADLRQLADTPAFQAAILEFLCADETLLLAFCANRNIDPQTVESARSLLAGPDPEWSA